MIKILTLTALMASAAQAGTIPYDRTGLDIVAEVGPDANGLTTYFTDPETRPCFTEAQVWWADVLSRGWLYAPTVLVGTNNYTKEPGTFYLLVDEPNRVEAWMVGEGDNRMCLHFLIETSDVAI